MFRYLVNYIMDQLRPERFFFLGAHGRDILN